nr:erythroblast NAD(P)(+)--arginine ADP-ribosyltransferase-like [Nothobranchius furzeri]
MIKNKNESTGPMRPKHRAAHREFSRPSRLATPGLLTRSRSSTIIRSVTYRRPKTFTGMVNQEIRFGIFASSSILSNLSQFGYAMCYKINTCNGAYLKEYPVLGKFEQEVLIPPYEKFRITKKYETKECKSAENLSDCEIGYVLESTGVLSNLDCQLTKCIII